MFDKVLNKVLDRFEKNNTLSLSEGLPADLAQASGPKMGKTITKKHFKNKSEVLKIYLAQIRCWC